MDRLHSMSVLLAVVDTGSFSAAGRHLGMPLATVSRKVAELESHLKTRLINRTTRQLSLTDAGQSYVAACRRVLEDIAEAERAATGEYAAPKGELVVTAPIVFGRLHLVPIVAEFLTLYPDINVHLALTDRQVHLLQEHVDAAVRIGHLPDSSLVATKVGATRPLVCASPAYLSRNGIPRHPVDLAKHQCIMFEGLFPTGSWIFMVGQSAVSVQVCSRLMVNTAEAAIAAAVKGLGLTNVLSYQVAELVANGALEVVLEEFKAELRPVSLVHAGQSPLPLKLRVFLDFVTPRLRACNYLVESPRGTA